MSTQCPICNGLYTLQHQCTQCNSPVIDEGRLEQMYGPYSPYREIDHMKMTNGYMDVAQHVCIHVVHCPNCAQQDLIHIPEVNI